MDFIPGSRDLPPLSRLLLGATLTLLLGLWDPSASLAGLSSENVVVIVNGKSAISRTVANHYIEFRKIPTKNVIVLDDAPSNLIVDLKTFRDNILRPILEQLDQRGLAATARVIAYSADLPTSVKISSHVAKITDPNVKKFQRGIASINGLTYFYRYVLSDDAGYLSFSSNFYARGKFIRHFINPFKGELKERFNQAVDLHESEEFEEAAKVWNELHEKHPGMPAIAIKAAECYSESGQDQRAVELLLAAIKAGWWSATYLQDTPSLQRHLEERRLKVAIKFLDQGPIAWQGPVAFASNAGWTVAGDRIPAKQGGIPYLMSCSLAVVCPNGSTLPDAIRILRRASKCDRTYPRGRFAFCSSNDVRAKTRAPGIADTIVYLQELGHDTEIFKSRLPTREGGIAGLMAGTPTATFDGSHKWILERGAIAENLTSYGGVFNNTSQTKLTEFLLAGAAMSSGAVTEPFSLQFKFPTPMLYAYYARGLSAIESFFQSVASPYQLLIVGDPLAQPFARPPDDYIDINFETEGKPKMVLTRRPLRLKVPKTPAAAIEISINDRPFRATAAAPKVEISWPAGSSGIFDVRATLTGLDSTEPRVTFLEQIEVPGDRAVPLATIVKSRTGVDNLIDDGSKASSLEIKLSCKGADRIELYHWGKPLAEVSGDEGSVEIEASQLGGGPLRLRPLAYFGEAQVMGRTIVDDPSEGK